MKQLDTRLIKKRSKLLGELQSRIIHNKEWINWQGEIIIDELGKDDSFVGRNDFYKPVVLKGSELKIGDKVRVRVKRVMQNYLEAGLV